MSADVLRRAAELMRERAEAATPGPWESVAGAFGNPCDGPDHMRVVQTPNRNATDAVARTEYEHQGGADSAHIASWHPAVALAVADWLDEVANEPWRHTSPRRLRRALNVARAYLGESA